MESLCSQKRKRKNIINGFIYVFQKDFENEVRLYECELRRKGQCKTKIKLDLGDNVIGQLYYNTQPPSHVKVKFTKVKGRIKDTDKTSSKFGRAVL